jgi:hypothetical protein
MDMFVLLSRARERENRARAGTENERENRAREPKNRISC